MYEQQMPGGAQPGGGGAIALNLKFSWLAFLLALFKPIIEINGHQVAKAWGRQVIPVPPGQHHVHVHVPYILPPRVGVADLPVTVAPGQTVELEYAAPTIAFMNGAMGSGPQKFPGMGISIGLLIASGVIFLCGCGGVILSAMASSAGSSY